MSWQNYRRFIMNQLNQSVLSPLLTSGITQDAHIENIKNKAPSQTFKRWLTRQYGYIKRAKGTDDEQVGSAIRNNLTTTEDAQGNKCAYVVRLLGAGNNAIEITIGNEKVSVFPQTTFIKARECLQALVDAVRNNEAIFNEVSSHLKARGYRKIPNFDEIDALMEGVTNDIE